MMAGRGGRRSPSTPVERPPPRVRPSPTGPRRLAVAGVRGSGRQHHVGPIRRHGVIDQEVVGVTQVLVAAQGQEGHGLPVAVRRAGERGDPGGAHAIAVAVSPDSLVELVVDGRSVIGRVARGEDSTTHPEVVGSSTSTTAASATTTVTRAAPSTSWLDSTRHRSLAVRRYPSAAARTVPARGRLAGRKGRLARGGSRPAARATDDPGIHPPGTTQWRSRETHARPVRGGLDGGTSAARLGLQPTVLGGRTHLPGAAYRDEDRAGGDP